MFGIFAAGIVFSAGLGAGSVEPQVGSLSRAVAVFSAADSNHDGKLSVEESRTIPVSAETFASEDADHDGFWSRDEFLVSYRKQLIAARQPVAQDLDAEVAKILALKRVEAVDPAKKPRCETSAKSADACHVSQRFETTLADVEAKCAARHASREDFQRLRNLVVLNGRAASRGPGAPSASSQMAMLAAIDRIERRSAQGQDAKEDFGALREASLASSSLVQPPANPQATTPQEASNPQPAATSTRPTPATPNASAAPVAPTPAGPAAARQRATPPPAPKPPPRPPVKKPESDPTDRSKP